MFGTTKSNMWSGSSVVLLKGEFSKDPNKPEDCQQCKLTCNPGWRIIYSCNATTDNECVCAKPNQFKDNIFDSCKDCMQCPPGFYPEIPCTIETRCVKCPVNYFSNRKNNVFDKCYPCTECKVKYKSRCNETHNATCDDVVIVTTTEIGSLSTDERTSHGPTRKKDGNSGENKILRTVVTPVLAFILIFFSGLIIIIWKKKMFNKRFIKRLPLAYQESELQSLNTGLLLRDQPARLLFELHRLLNPNEDKNWEDLAGELGFTYNDIGNFKAEPTASAETMLASWQTKSASTVDRLHECLLKIGRQDIAEYLAVNMKRSRESTV